MPYDLVDDLLAYQHGISTQKYEQAAIGRGDDFLHNDFVRTDEICWINGESEPGQRWLDWTSQLQQFLNRRLFMGLFSFESYFAHYASGSYYKRHYDAFKGETNRVLSLVAYLNPGWGPDDGGEMVLYRNDNDLEGIKVVPLHGTLVLFLSEEFLHEVLPASRDRYSAAGWFRVSTSLAGKIDPPR